MFKRAVREQYNADYTLKYLMSTPVTSNTSNLNRNEERQAQISGRLPC
jgi:hypothetical protein